MGNKIGQNQGNNAIFIASYYLAVPITFRNIEHYENQENHEVCDL